MKTTRTWALMLVLGLVTALLAGVAGTASGQTPQGQITAINGSFPGPVSVTAGSIELASELEFPDTTDSVIVDVVDGGYDVVFTGDEGTASTTTAVAPATAWTVVSGYGEDGEAAASYPVEVDVISDGKAKLAVWNATTADVQVSIGDSAVELAPGEASGPTEADPGDVTVTVGETSETYTLQADQYLDVFVVNDGTADALAAALIPSMTELIETLGGTPPPDPGITVPDVAGQTAEDATATLVGAGFTAVGEIEEASDTVEAGIAIRTEPAAGATVPADTPISLFVSTGPSTVVVPDVTGMPVDDAIAELDELGFTTTVEEEASEELDEGLVISTNPKGGTEVVPGTEVTVIVSTGPEDVEVPDFVGMTVEEATAAAEAAGLEATFVEDPDDPDPEGIVVDQDPEAGEVVPAGSEVTLQLSPATQDPWTSIKVDPDLVLTAAGLNFLPDSVSEVTVLGTSLAAKDVVDASGFWLVEIDISSLDPNAAYEALVTGTAEDGTPYERTFVVPPTGEKTEEPVEEEGIPAWVWFLLGGVVLVALVLGVVLISGAGSSSEAGGEDVGGGEADTD